MLKTKISLLFSALFGMLGIALLNQALHIRSAVVEPMGPEAYPLVVAALIIGAAFYNLVVDLIGLRSKQAVGAAPQAAAPAPGVSDGSHWKSPLGVGALGVSYVLGLTFVGFFVSTFCFTLLSMMFLHYFERRAGLMRQALALYLPLSVGIVAVLYVGIKALRIYTPTQAWLW